MWLKARKGSGVSICQEERQPIKDKATFKPTNTRNPKGTDFLLQPLTQGFSGGMMAWNSELDHYFPYYSRHFSWEVQAHTSSNSMWKAKYPVLGDTACPRPPRLLRNPALSTLRRMQAEAKPKIWAFSEGLSDWLCGEAIPIIVLGTWLVLFPLKRVNRNSRLSAADPTGLHMMGSTLLRSEKYYRTVSDEWLWEGGTHSISSLKSEWYLPLKGDLKVLSETTFPVNKSDC